MPVPAPNGGYLKWVKEDFTKHGYLATYAIGECRCEICVKHWEDWVADPADSKK
tara:strand:- start:10360 stop:10521 length:162 start_codon:yes stop_codon:yes gene_type:complete